MQLSNNTRLSLLCRLHSQQGGTIHQFNGMYGLDFLAMPQNDFAQWCVNYLDSLE